jgi:SagB-type dehydrogenase family enzyme
MRLESPAAIDLIYQLGRAVPPNELTQKLSEEEKDHMTGLLALLMMGDFVFPATSEGQLYEDEDEALMQWEFHDLLFHSRSRTGRHNNPLGGTYRFLHAIPPQPAVKQGLWPETIPLPQPDMKRLCAEDPSLAAVMEDRVSVREYDDRPITVAQLGEFLYRVARVKEITRYAEIGDVTRRPYPGSGASYEMEFYLTIDRCEGLKPGFYWYDPVHHMLSHIQEPDKNTDSLLDEAALAMGVEERPQILITLTARFQRVSWKYQSLAYALILKDVGVIYATMYLVATAMGLAPCAQGVGDSDCFTRLSGTDYLQETSVGEFTLGRKPI